MSLLDPNTQAPPVVRAAERGVGAFLIRVLAFIGVGLGGAQGAAAPDLDLLQQDAYQDAPVRQLTPNELATAVVKGAIDQNSAATIARRSGIDSANFQGLVDLTGNPPGPETLLSLWNRGVIDEAEFLRGVREGLIRTEWGPALANLKVAVMSPAEVVEAAVQGHLPIATAAEIAAQSGVSGADFDVLYQTAGNPPGLSEVLELLNRKLIDEATAVQAIKESRLKDKYIPQALELRVYLPPVRSIGVLLDAGVITTERALQLYADRGLRPEDAAAYVARASHTKTRTHKELAVSEVATLYEERAITSAQATGFLKALSYTDQEAAFVLEVYDLRRARKLYDQAVNVIRSRYVSRKIGQEKASVDLDALKVPPDQRDHLLQVWGLERDASPRLLSEAQLARAWKLGLIDRPTFVDRAMALGYDAADASTLADLTVPPSTPGGP